MQPCMDIDLNFRQVSNRAVFVSALGISTNPIPASVFNPVIPSKLCTVISISVLLNGNGARRVGCFDLHV